jgi:iron complex outermembrane receptor protein
MKGNLLLLLLFVITSSLAHAQEKAHDENLKKGIEYESVSLDDLLDATVFTASKKKEKQHESPAIVSVITAQEIADMGADTLYDVLATVPGVEVYETYYGYTSLTFRGILQTHYNDKSLLLVNGHPIYDTINWSWYLESIPVTAIKQIEIIRGPGSTLYGTNAFAGVINIITKQGGEEGSNVAYITAGKYNTIDIGFSAGGKHEDISVFIAGQHRDSHGYPFEAIDEEGAKGTPAYPDDRYAYENDFDNVYATIGWKGLKLSGMYFVNDKDKFGLIPSFVSTGERRLEGIGTDLRFEHSVSDEFDIFLMGYYDIIRKQERIEWYPPVTALKDGGIGGPEFQDFSGFKWGAEGRINYQVLDWLGAMLGLVYERTEAEYYYFRHLESGEIDPGASAMLDPDEFAGVPEYKYDDVHTYLQLTAHPIDRLGLTAGVRYNYNSSYGSFVAPRAGVVYSLAEGFHIKLLYGRAYRAPSFFEKYVDTTNVLYGADVQKNEPTAPFSDQDDYILQPEVIDSIDLGMDWKIYHHILRVNFFYMTNDDLIDRVRQAARQNADGSFTDERPIPQYGNSNGYQAIGAEFELRGSLLDNMTYFLNASYRYFFDDDGELDWRTPILGNLGLTYHLPKPVQSVKVSTYLSMVGGREGELASGETSSIDPYLLWNLNLSIALTKRIEFSILLHNLLDQDYAYPEYIRRNINEVPGGPGLSAYGRLRVSF